MCEFFSCIATRDGRLLFTEADSHETIITRAHLRDTDRHLRHWVRVEVTPKGDGWGPVKVDEPETPAWWDEDRAAIDARVLALARRVQPAWAAYEAAKQPAWAAYEAVEQSAFAAYEAAKQSARAAYEAVEQPAWAAYEAAKQPALAAYVDALRRIPGYVPEKGAA